MRSSDWIIGIVIVATFAATLIFVHWRHRRLLLRLKEDRAGYTKQDFIDFFVDQGVRARVADDVYRVLQMWLPVRDFPVAPHDGLSTIYGMEAHEEIDGVIRDLGYPEPTKSELDTYDWDALYAATPRLKKDVSVAALVHFLNWVLANGEERRV